MASEAMQRLTQIATTGDTAKVAELETVSKHQCGLLQRLWRSLAHDSISTVWVGHDVASSKRYSTQCERLGASQCTRVCVCARVRLLQMKVQRSDLEAQVQECTQQLAAVDRDESNRAQRVALLEEQLQKRLDAVESHLALTNRELEQARAQQLRMRIEMDDALRGEGRGEHAARLEAGMLREHIAEQDATNEQYRERSATIEAEGRLLAAQLAHFA